MRCRSRAANSGNARAAWNSEEAYALRRVGSLLQLKAPVQYYKAEMRRSSHSSCFSSADSRRLCHFERHLNTLRVVEARVAEGLVVAFQHVFRNADASTEA